MAAKGKKLLEFDRRLTASMPSSPSKFKSLNDLALEWSEQGGEPPLLTLRRIAIGQSVKDFPKEHSYSRMAKRSIFWSFIARCGASPD
jgi:hypothetical protein